MMARFLIFPLLLAWTCWTSGAESPAESSRLVTRHGLTVRVDGEVTSVWRELRSVVDLQLTLVSDTVATPPLADDLAFFVRKELLALGYAAAAAAAAAGGRERRRRRRQGVRRGG
ncbi:MAG: hypothetical protein ACK5TY_03685, partial [Verrucomicrobiota bacterium]